MSSLEALKCKECGERYELTARYVCDICFGPLEVAYDYSGLDASEVKRRIQGGPQDIWRYADFLPFEQRPQTALAAGVTPLVRADRLAQHLGVREVWVKNDAANPTHSFKDRVVTVALAKARELGFQVVACASTGNLANSGAAHAAGARATPAPPPAAPPGLESYVFIPSDLEEQKVLATGVYGTKLVAVRGNYDDVNRLCTELSADRDWAFVNVNMRPYYSQGSKTLGFEICEQLGWTIPDRIIAPVASGSLFTKIARGIEEWREVGLVEGEAPTMNGSQALGCSPVAHAYEQGWDICKPVKPDTIAKSLAIGNPADGPYALELARRTGGTVDAVTDAEIVEGIRLLAETTGIFTETAGGVTTAVLRKLAARGDIGPEERVVVVITGEGLKTLDVVRGSFETHEIEPSLAAFEAGVPEAVAAAA